ncbi:rhodanese-like domain-containing protein, partial [Acidiphilium sp.]|uniref:rhodanese-like domain-containing protein n=1 Tax=Acidiphilium sp. TaxID=527 RepID=UPI003CFD51FD
MQRTKLSRTRISGLAMALGAIPALPMAIPALSPLGIARANAPDAATLQTMAQAVARGENLTTPHHLQGLILAKRRDFTLIDLRAPDEFAAAHIQGATNIPLPKLLEPAEVVKLRRMPQVIVYSTTTDEAAQGVVLLRLSGVTATALDGGLLAWSHMVAAASTPQTAAIVRALNDCPQPAPAVIPALGSIVPASATSPAAAPTPATTPPAATPPAKPKAKTPI